VLEPAGPGRTRLIERTRGWFGKGNPGTKVLMPTLGFGVFVMERRQMLGLKQRVERNAHFDRIEKEAAVPGQMKTIAHNGESDVPVITPAAG
jgi:hypothetical protein